MKLEISPITTYCDENELFETKVGQQGMGDLYFSAWGKTEEESRERAKVLSTMIDKQDLF